MMRMAAAVVGGAMLATLALRLHLNMAANDWGLLSAMWSVFRFFTNWTNALACVALLWIALGRRVHPSVLSCLLMSMVLVSGVYYGLLYKDTNFQGLDILVDWMLHTVNPLGLLVFWLLFVDKSRVAYGHTALWQLYPLVYCGFVLLRGQFDGVYPYNFINPTVIGWASVGRNVVLLAVAFIVVGLAVVAIGRRLNR